MSSKNKNLKHQYLDQILPFGSFVATTNDVGYGAQIGVFLGKGEYAGTVFICWLFSNKGTEQVFTEDFRKTFYPIKLTGYDSQGHILFKPVRKQFLRLN